MEHYDINRLWIERPDLYDRTKLAKGHADRLTLPRAKRIASQEHARRMPIPGARLPYGIAPETACPSDALIRAVNAKLIADRYIARVPA
jgi:hypothetical protein